MPGSQIELFQKSNIWINARYNYDKLTELVIDLLALQVDPMADTLGTASITAAELHDLLGSNTVWRRIRELASNLREVGIEIWDDDAQDYVGVNFFRNVRARNNRKDGFRITGHWNDDCRGFILHKRRNYTGISPLVKAQLNGPYARRVYELTRQFIDTGVYRVGMDEIKQKIQGEKITYASYMERTLRRACDEINAVDDCDFTLDFVIRKRRRRDPLIEFNIHRKPNRWRLPADEQTSFRMTPMEWLRDLEDNHPEEFSRRYEAENVVASATLFDGTPEEIDLKTRTRMMQAYAAKLTDQVRSARSLAGNSRP